MSERTGQFTNTKALSVGILAGFVGGIVMGAIVALMGMMMDMPAFFVLGAEAMGMLGLFGWVLHFVVSIIVGIVFGVVVVNIEALRPTGVGKTVGLGVGAGILAYVILFVPIMMLLMPPFLMQAMGMSPAQVGALAPILLGAGFLVHVVYGAVLGGVFWAGRPK